MDDQAEHWSLARGEATDTAVERRDLIKRLFAVAISLGFGAAVARSEWIRAGAMPTLVDLPQIAIIGVAFSVTILSWDGYLSSIARKPLNRIVRFAIDVFLVFSYMFLFLTSNHTGFWLPILCGMFFIYAVWDFLSLLEYPNQFLTGAKSRRAAAWAAYTRGFTSDSNVNSGPIITLMWFSFLTGLCFIYYSGLNHYIACAIVIIALFMYRNDKQKMSNKIRGFSFLGRTMMILSLLMVAIGSRCLTVI